MRRVLGDALTIGEETAASVGVSVAADEVATSTVEDNAAMLNASTDTQTVLTRIASDGTPLNQQRAVASGSACGTVRETVLIAADRACRPARGERARRWARTWPSPSARRRQRHFGGRARRPERRQH